MKKKLITMAIVLTLVVSCVFALGCDGGGGTTPPEYDFTFTGNITLNDINYDIVMTGKDKAFTVDAGNLQDVTNGSYTFTEGKGYTFSFTDASGTLVRTKYDTTSKEFSFIYTLDLGSARGNGNVMLKYKDDKFTMTEAWDEIPVFTGSAAWFGGVLVAQMRISCTADGEFTMFSTDTEGVEEISGTYTSANGIFTFVTGDDTYVTEADENGLQSMTILNVHRPALDAYNAGYTSAVMTQQVLTVD